MAVGRSSLSAIVEGDEEEAVDRRPLELVMLAQERCHRLTRKYLGDTIAESRRRVEGAGEAVRAYWATKAPPAAKGGKKKDKDKKAKAKK